MGAARGLAAGTTFVAVAVGLAFNAAAEAPIGRYTATVIDDSSELTPSVNTETLRFDPCGRGCTHVISSGGEFELHQQDNGWTGTAQSLDGETCTHTVDAHLVWTHTCTGPTVRAQLTKSS
jgi:hypothetical protein